MGEFHRIVAIVGTFLVSISFFLAFTTRNKISTPKYMENFYLYPLLGLLLSFNTLAADFLKSTTVFVQATIEKIVFTIDFVFWGYFFLQVLDHGTVQKYIKTTFTFFLIFTVPVFIICMEETLYHFYFRAYHNIGKLVFCLSYFYSIFNCSPKMILKNEPVFWVNSGLLFYTTVTIPIFLSYYYLATNRYIDILSILFPLTNISIILMHLLFIKSYLCTVQQTKTY